MERKSLPCDLLIALEKENKQLFHGKNNSDRHLSLLPGHVREGKGPPW